MTSPADIPFEIQASDASDCVVIRLSGEASHDQSLRMQNALMAEANRESRGIVVDMTRLVAITSVGLGAIVSTYVSCQRRNKPFRICGVSGKVETMFQVAKLTRLFQIEPTVDDAIRSIAAA